MKAAFVLLLFGVALASGPSVAAPADVAAREAQSLFADGTAALQRGELAEARRLLEASLARHEHPATAFNLAVTLRGLGAPLEALAPLENLEAGRYGPLPPEQRSEVRQMLAETRAMLGTLELELAGPPTAELRIDGHAAGTLARGTARTVRVNPGVRLIEVDAAGFRPLIKRVDVPGGSVTREQLVLLPVAIAVEPSAATTAATPERASGAAKTWLWIGIAAVAVGASIALVLWRPFERSPERDPVFGTVSALGTRE